jgi:VWFA-related protein
LHSGNVLGAAHDIISRDLSVSPLRSQPQACLSMKTGGLITRIFLLSTVCSLLAVPAAGQQPAGRSDDVVRVNTELVQTDFMVFDKQGNFVDGLKRDQFTLKIDGKARDISFFDRIAAGSRNEEAQLAAARGASVSALGKGPAVPLDRGRIVLFFLDDLHLSPSSVSQARELLKKFIDREMRQNDQAAIASVSGQLGFVQQVTDDKAVMLAAVDRLRAQQSTTRSNEYPPMSEYQALQIQQHDIDVFEFFVDALIKQEPMLPRQTAGEMVNARASQLLEEGSSITTRTLATLKGFVDTTRSMPGRKIIFFVSDGFFLDRNNSNNYDRLQLITAAAARSGVVIYSIDARGLATGLPDASTSVAFDPSGRLSRGSMGELRASQDVMNALASDTGGRAFFNSNALSAAVTTALKETSVYYLLSWRPENEEQRNPKFRKIDLSVSGRPELVVRFRRGFGETGSDTATKVAKDSGSAPASKPPNEQINAVLRAPYPTSSLPVAIALNFLDTTQYGGTLTTSIKVGTSSLAVESQAGAPPTAVVDVAGLVLNDQGKSVSAFNKRFTIRITPNGAMIKPPDNIFYNHFALIKPGLYQVRVAAVDVKNETSGSAFRWIEIPDLQSKELALSSLIVGERRGESELAQADPSSNESAKPAEIRQVSLNVDHRFARSSYLRFLTFIYNATAGSLAAPASSDPSGASIPTSAVKVGAPDLAVQVQVFRDNEPVITTPLHKINTDGQPDLQRVSYAADVALNDLQPGAYVLQVTVIDRLAKASATQKLSFQVE